jgi:PEP-CTERM putative exosortase interaction domain
MMNRIRNRWSSSGRKRRTVVRGMALAAVLAAGVTNSASAINVSVSGFDQARNQDLLNFLQANFLNVNLSYGNYSDPANIPAGTDVLIIGRIVLSSDYANAVNSATFNGLNIPVVSLTSYVSRPDGGRWGWHSGAVAGGGSIAGNETTVTADGAGIFGSAGPADWWSVSNADSTFNAAGSGTVGTGQILATIGGNILVAGWHAGDTSAGGVTFTADRLLFNLPDSDPNTGSGVVPNTVAGQQAFIKALEAYTPLVAIVPEPSSAALLCLGGGSLFFMIRRRIR